MSRYLFNISNTNQLEETPCSRDVLASLVSHLSGAERLELNSYRAGLAIVEMVARFADGRVFCLSIQEGQADIAPLTTEDIRVAHMYITLPDITDILLLITQIVRLCRFRPAIHDEPASASLMTFTPA